MIGETFVKHLSMWTIPLLFNLIFGAVLSVNAATLYG